MSAHSRVLSLEAQTVALSLRRRSDASAETYMMFDRLAAGLAHPVGFWGLMMVRNPDWWWLGWGLMVACLGFLFERYWKRAIAIAAWTWDALFGVDPASPALFELPLPVPPAALADQDEVFRLADRLLFYSLQRLNEARMTGQRLTYKPWSRTHAYHNVEGVHTGNWPTIMALWEEAGLIADRSSSELSIDTYAEGYTCLAQAMRSQGFVPVERDDAVRWLVPVR